MWRQTHNKHKTKTKLRQSNEIDNKNCGLREKAHIHVTACECIYVFVSYRAPAHHSSLMVGFLFVVHLLIRCQFICLFLMYCRVTGFANAIQYSSICHVTHI